jgi:hypothetical protein
MAGVTGPDDRCHEPRQTATRVHADRDSRVLCASYGSGASLTRATSCVGLT